MRVRSLTFPLAALLLVINAGLVQAAAPVAAAAAASSAATAPAESAASASSPAGSAALATPAAAVTAPVAPAPSDAAPAVVRPGPVQLAPMSGPSAGQVGGASAGSLLQTIFALLAVLGLLAVLAWALKRYGPKAASGSAHLRIVGGLNLGGRERIMVVEVAGQWIVVGAAPGRVNALATMPRPEGAGAEATLHPHVPPATSFSEWLKQTIDKRNAK
ncbi:MAG: flagellar biosynthetic protein FliO [Massilia sp.]